LSEKVNEELATAISDICGSYPLVLLFVKILSNSNIVTNKKVDFIKFVHMKNHAQDWQAVRTSWLKQVGIYLTKDLDLIIGNYLQTGIFHYVENDFVTDDIISAYEEIVI